MDYYEHIPVGVRIHTSGYVSAEESEKRKNAKGKGTKPPETYIMFKDGVEVCRGPRKKLCLIYGHHPDTISRRAKTQNEDRDGYSFEKAEGRKL